MLKRSISITAVMAFVILLCMPVFASEIVQDFVDSHALERSVKMNVYLPDNYKDTNDALPVVYMLHGAGADETAWVVKGGIKVTADELIARNQLRQSVIVMPTTGPASWYADANAMNAETALVEDIIPYVEQHYNVRTDRAGRSIAGLSMGGYGALNMSLSHPNLFCAAGVLSPAIYDPFPPTTSASRKTPQFSDNGEFDADAWTQSLYPARLSAYYEKDTIVPMWIESGDHDRFGIALASAKLYWTLHETQPDDIEYRVINGDHDWLVFRESSISALQYMSKKCEELDARS